MLITHREEWAIKNARTMQGDPEPLTLDRSRHLKSVYVREVLAVEKKQVTSYRLTFREWTYRLGKTVHEDLKGHAFTLTRRKGKFVLPDGDKLAFPAQRYLERAAARLTHPELETFLPKRALKEGDTWSVDPKDALPHLVEDARLDVKRSRVKGVLEHLTPGKPSHAQLKVSSALQLKTLPGTDTQVTKGAVWKVETAYDLPFGQPLTRATYETTVAFEGVGKNQLPDGAPYTLEASATVRRIVTVKVLPK